MSAEAAAFTRSWPVGRYTATLTAPRPKAGAASSAVVEWQPALPHRLTPEELRQYRAGRDAALTDMAQQFGIAATVMEA